MLLHHRSVLRKIFTVVTTITTTHHLVTNQNPGSTYFFAGHVLRKFILQAMQNS
jgi:hypothetical protein